MCNRRSSLLAIALVSYGLTGCGMTVPDISEVWEQDYPGDVATNTPKISGTAQLEFEIRKHIWCELKEAVQAAAALPTQDIEGKKVVDTRPLMPRDWGAQVSLSLEVDESSALNPGLSLNTPMHAATTNFAGEFLTSSTALSTATYPFLSTPQSYAFGLGGTLSSTATRIDKFDPYFSVPQLMKPITSQGVCNTHHPENDPFVGIGVSPATSSPLVGGDLGLKDWLIGVLVTNRLLPSDSPGVSPSPASPGPTPKKLEAERAVLRKQGYTVAEVTQILASKAAAASESGIGSAGGGSGAKLDSALSIEIKFIIVSNANVTPTWKLVRVSANTGATPLFAVGRTRTHDLIITFGAPTRATENTHLASQIGNSVSSANRASVPAE